jgi:hypothetical protein
MSTNFQSFMILVVTGLVFLLGIVMGNNAMHEEGELTIFCRKVHSTKSWSKNPFSIKDFQ